MIYLFDSYAFDDENLCLTRHGQRLPLEPRALAVLLLMVRSNGKLLKKDAILKEVWRNTVVEESTLSRVIAMLRKQLGDDPRNPRFIETVPTLGYRFIAQIDQQRIDDPPPQSFQSTSISGEDATAHTPAVASRFDSRAGRRTVWTAVAALLLAGGGALWALRMPRPVIPPKKSMVLSDFTNSTGEPVFDGALRQAMMVQLEQSPVICTRARGVPADRQCRGVGRLDCRSRRPICVGPARHLLRDR